MLTLIAESKTMADCSRPFCGQSPLFDLQADAIIDSLRSLSAVDLSAAVKISPAMGARLRGMIYEFADKSLGAPAIEAYTGVVFKALDYPTLTPEAKARCQSQVRIISSLYGWLRPDDCIKAYRFDYTTRLAPENQTFAAYWRDYVTDAILKYLADNNCRDILDLMPADAARAVNAKRVGEIASVWKAEFKQVTDGGALKTPHAERLKTLRGALLRHILLNNITTADQLHNAETAQFYLEDIDTTRKILHFHTA